MLSRLDELGLRDNTIIVLWGDHGWHLGEHSIWGKHALFEESLRSPLIVSHAGIAKPGASSEAVVETLDIFPTLAELAKLPAPEFAHGVSLQPLLKDPGAAGHDAFSYKGDARTVRTATHRLIAHRKGELELYDHRSKAGETKNLAESEPELAVELLGKIEARFK
jgi:iduronate 2-sulfatase